ncbi:MAG: thermonuclease family protein [Hyphomicrobiaceae bacterium]
MFGWGKKPDGFEWHKYIRTTIKLKRERRRERVEELRQSAVDQVQAAGAKIAAGSKAAGAAARDGAVAGAGVAARVLRTMPPRMAAALAPHVHRAAGAAARAAPPVREALSQPGLAVPLAVAGLAAVLAGVLRWRAFGFDRDAVLPLLVGVLLLVAALPAAPHLARLRLSPDALRLSPDMRAALFTPRTLGIAAGLVIASVLGWFALSATPNLPHLTALSPAGGSTSLTGHATALSGEHLRVRGELVHLAGIDAPEVGQRCARPGNRAWRCGAAARDALARLTRGRTVSCTLNGVDEQNVPLAICKTGEKVVNEELVRSGHVFAASGFFASYSSAEKAAREAKAGLWVVADPERPADFRNRLWDAAKQRAPDGCPIKGNITGAGRVYYLPWSPDYGRAQVQRARGERWFCSESEAISAGWKPSERG